MTRITAGTAVTGQGPIGELVAPAGKAPAGPSAASSPTTTQRHAPARSGVDRPTPQSGSTAPHGGIDVRALCADLLRWENNKAFMYVDTRGFVTTGIGNKLSNAQEAIALSWQHKTTGLPATPAEVRAAFQRVRATYVEFRNQNPDPKISASASHYEQATDLVLPRGKATELANSRLRDDFLPKLQCIFPDFDRYPVPAQRALVDMIYTLGAKGLETKFPTLVAACRRGDFATAANHCHRKAQANEHRKGDERNDATRNLLIEAASLTASVQGMTKELRL